VIPEDAEILAREPQLSGLRWLFAPERLPEVAPAWFAGVTNLTIAYFQYKPATNATAVVTGQGAEGDVWWTVRVFASGDDAKFLQAARRSERTGGGGVAALGLTVDPFPADPVMPALGALIRNPGSRLRDLSPAVAARGDRWRVRPLRYKPERRFVGRVDDGDAPFAVVRVYPPDRFMEAYEAWKRVGSGPLLGRSRSRGTLLVPWVAGGALTAAGWVPDQLRGVGVALARLHARRTPRGWRGRVRPVLGDALRAAVALAHVLPAEATRIAHVADRLPRVATADATWGIVHGDLHVQQVIVTDDGVALIDVDEAGIGPGAWDVATFAVDVMRGTGERASLEPFFDGYGGPPAGLGRYVAWAYLLRAGRAFRERLHDWPAEARACLDAAERAWEGGW
jgi:hypothetical protein